MMILILTDTPNIKPISALFNLLPCPYLCLIVLRTKEFIILYETNNRMLYLMYVLYVKHELFLLLMNMLFEQFWYYFLPLMY